MARVRTRKKHIHHRRRHVRKKHSENGELNYLIEFRFHGKAKHEIKELIHDVKKKFRLTTRRAVPHISLAGPFYTNDEERLIRDFRQLCVDNPLMKFKVEGFNTFEHSNVVFVDIMPSKELDNFRWNLSKTLGKYCELKPFDYEKDFSFHATIAMKLEEDKFKRIKDYIKNKPKLNFDHVVVRLTLLKGQKILKEYDFLLRRLLDRKLAKSKDIYSKTSDLLKAYFEGRFNPEDFMGSGLRVPRKNIISKIKDIFAKPKTYITSDLHLDHTNIIKYCKRPFLNTEDMNKTLIDNWNNIVSRRDRVYFLGDMSFGKNRDIQIPSRPADYWMKKLNGDIFFIRGFSYEPSEERNQHDKISRTKNVFDNLIIEYKGKKFYLVHDPANIPSDWDGWAICGHHHNNKLEKYPFIDKKNKRINISTELTKFRPVDMDDLIKKIEE